MNQVHIAITRQVKPGMERAFEDALRGFARESLMAPGTTGVHLIGPIPSSNCGEYGILRSFESEAACEAFYDSELFRRWDEYATQFVIGGWTRRRLHGLDIFFQGVRGGPPPKWKMAVVTWLGVFPSVLLWSWVLRNLLSGLPSLLATAVISGFVVATLAWVAMPLLTQVFATWLSSSRENVGD
jgi:antibiotic biosynthesis monooxygenase (ABM) superfamily enzyme